MTHHKNKDRYGLSLKDEDNKIGDIIYFGGNQGQIVDITATGQIIVKFGDQQQLVDPQVVPYWNQRSAYEKLVRAASNGEESPGDAYISKDVLLSYILGKTAEYSGMRYKNPELRSQPGWIEKQIYMDILNLLGRKNTNQLPSDPNTS